MAKRRRKTKTHLRGAATEGGGSSTSAPKSFVIRSGKVSTNVGNLASEVRQVMEPNTASRLKERKSNKLRDFLTMCGPLGVTHLVLFSQKSARDVKGTNSVNGETVGNINLRIARAPRGPTVTFRVNKFALCRDVVKAQRKVRATGGEYLTAPLLVLNNFGSAEKHVKLLVNVFQGLFPPIHVQTMHLSQARRIVLLHYNDSTQTIEWRHYLISIRPVGVSRRIRKVIEGTSGSKGAVSKLTSGGIKRVPNLSSTNDISEYLLGNQNGQEGGFEIDASSASEADSDVEEGGKASNHVQLPDAYIGRGNIRDSQRAVRLIELGPRMELRCVKIEEGIPGAGKDGKGTSQGGNEVLWHDYVKKSTTDSNKQRKILAEKEAQRQKRRLEQEENVRRKKEEKEVMKTSKRGKCGQGKAVNEEDEDGEDEPEVEMTDEEEDEFAYEDAHGSSLQNGDLFEEDDADIDEEDSIGSEQSDEEEPSEDDESDLSPIEVGFEDIDSESDTEETSKKRKMNGKKSH